MSDKTPLPPRGGSIPAGLEEPPRYWPPNPQHPEIPQTFDPRVSVQLERAARDREAGMPGLAAREDAETFVPDPRRGAGPQPMPPRRRDVPTPTAGEDGGVVSGAPPRETVVTFNQQFGSYFAGESAAFSEDEAARLGELGVTGEGGGGGPPATEAPVNVDVPHVTQAGDTLNCTMGNWNGEPTGYAYQWKLDGVDVGTDANTYTVNAGDAGQTATCVVTATNGIGSTTAPPSDGVVVEAPP
jgi:hypothetical protein